MIVPAWEGFEQISESMGVQESQIPKINYVRMLLINPSVADLSKCQKVLEDKGVPSNANIEFSRWNNPPNNWYVHASWV